MDEIENNVVDVVIEVHTQALYDEIFKTITIFDERSKTVVYTKYKIIAKKVKLVAIQLPYDIDKHIKQAEKE